VGSLLPSRRTQRRSIETRERLVAAAVHELGEKDFGGTSTREICARASVAQSALGYHFSSKEALWKAAADSLADHFKERMRERLDGLRGVDVVTRLRLLLVDAVRFSAAHLEFHRFRMQEGTGSNERLAWFTATHVEAVVRMFVPELVDSEGGSRWRDFFGYANSQRGEPTCSEYSRIRARDRSSSRSCSRWRLRSWEALQPSLTMRSS
jgi:AcrR family transcriptional regulator